MDLIEDFWADAKQINFRGTLGRQRFWVYHLIVISALLAVALLLFWLADTYAGSASFMGLLNALAMVLIIMMGAITAYFVASYFFRRLTDIGIRDTGMKVFVVVVFILLFLSPLIQFLIFVLIGCLPTASIGGKVFDSTDTTE
tara:strand:+ start:835 stop:1263 length:429 start_codon:yes stop_codon:yes gene_type:complete